MAVRYILRELRRLQSAMMDAIEEFQLECELERPYRFRRWGWSILTFIFVAGGIYYRDQHDYSMSILAVVVFILGAGMIKLQQVVEDAATIKIVKILRGAGHEGDILELAEHYKKRHVVRRRMKHK